MATNYFIAQSRWDWMLSVTLATSLYQRMSRFYAVFVNTSCTVRRCCCLFGSSADAAKPQRQKGQHCTTAKSFSLMNISEAHLTSWLSLRSPLFPGIMVSDWSLMIHFFDKNHLLLALRDKTLLDLTLNSGSTRQTNTHYSGDPVKSVRGHSCDGISGLGVWRSRYFIICLWSLHSLLQLI